MYRVRVHVRIPPTRPRRPTSWGALALLASLLTSAPVHADDTAERLFQEGLDDMLAGKYDTGCPALAESYRLDPLPGALFTLAECEAKWGKLATALAHYRDYLSRVQGMSRAGQAKQRQRVGVAEAQVEALERQAPRLVLRLVEAPPPGTVVRRDGKRVPLSQLGLPILVDPGKHDLEVAVEGRPEVWTVTIEVESGARAQVNLQLPEEGAADDASSGTGQAWEPYLGWGLVGLGGAGVLVGTVAGGITVGHASTVDEECAGNLCRSQEGLDAADAATTTGAVSTVGFVVGGAALAAGVLVLLLLPEDEEGEGDRTGWHLAPADVGAGLKLTW